MLVPPDDPLAGNPLKFAPYAAVAFCLAMFVALPNAAPAFLLPAKPSVDERGLDRGAALEVEERLDRLRRTPVPENMFDREVPLMEAWVDFRRNAARWAPALCRIARSPIHPLRLEAIEALRFYGSEHGWEHLSHGRLGTTCILGCEPQRDACERVLVGLTEEGGAVRRRALCALSAYRTHEAAACLVAATDAENLPFIAEYRAWQRYRSVDLYHMCACEPWVKPYGICIFRGDEIDRVGRILLEWREVECGANEAVPSTAAVRARWALQETFLPR